MKFINLPTSQAKDGLSIVELILAVALFFVFAAGAIGAALKALQTNRLGNETTIATQYAAEGIEAARSIRNQGFSGLVVSAGTGVVRNGSDVWSFSGTNNTFTKYTRTLTVSTVQRDASNNIVSSGGTIDSDTMKVTSTVTWNVSPTRPNSVVLVTYFTNWRETSLPATTCGMYCINQGYTAGTCRQNSNQCTQSGESYQSGGDIYCPGGNQKSCCCL